MMLIRAMAIRLLRRLLVGRSAPSRRERQSAYLESLRRMRMRVGDNTAIYNCTLDSNFPFLIEIGSNCIVTHATILAHDASFLVREGKVMVGRVRILDHCFIGAGTVVLPGVTIGPRATVGAMSVVTRDVPPDAIVAGNPARVVSSVDESLKRGKNGTSGKISIDVNSEGLVLSEAEEQTMIAKVKLALSQGRL